MSISMKGEKVLPFGEEIKAGEAAFKDRGGTIIVGRLYPFPVYVIHVRRVVRVTKVIVGWRRAARWANEMWEATE